MSSEQEQFVRSIEQSITNGTDVNRTLEAVSTGILAGREPDAANKMLTEVTQQLIDSGQMPRLVNSFATTNFNQLDLNGDGSISQDELQRIDQSRLFNRSLSAMEHQIVKYMRGNFKQIAEANDDWGLDSAINSKDLTAYESKMRGRMSKAEAAQSINAVFGQPEIFDKVDTDKDGKLSEPELKNAIESPSTAETERVLLRFMRDNRSEISKISNDERLWESKISKKDISGFAEKNKPTAYSNPMQAANYYSLPQVPDLKGNAFVPDLLVEFGKQNLKALDIDNNGFVTREELERVSRSSRWNKSLTDAERKAISELGSSLELVQRSHRDENWYKDRKGVTQADLEAYRRDQIENRADIPTKPGDHDMSLTIGGVKRDYTVHIPPGYDGSKPAPVLYFYHYFTGSSQEMAEYSRMNDIADRENFIVVYPNAKGYVGNFVRQWNLNNNPSYRVDEVAFARSLMDTVESKLNVDKNRQYIAGYSNGGMLAHELASKMSDRIAAMAAVSGCQNPGVTKPIEGISVLMIHGTRDRLVPLQGRIFTPLFPRMSSLEQGREFWCTANKTDQHSTRQVSSNVVCDTYTNSVTGKEVAVMTMNGSGHGFPGSGYSLDGNANLTINGAEEIWKFVSRHSRNQSR
jgi:polyhydroxybutyrate depolymerase